MPIATSATCQPVCFLFRPKPPVRRVSIGHMCDMWGRFQHDRPMRWALLIAGWRVHRITGAQSCSILQRTTIRMHNIPTYHSLWRWLDTSTARRLRPEPRAARAGDMESALYHFSVWSVYGRIGWCRSAMEWDLVIFAGDALDTERGLPLCLGR